MKKINFKNLKFSINNTVVITFAIVLVLLLNITAVLVETKFPKLKLDLTESRVTKISNETKSMLKRLDEGDTEIDIIYLKGTKDADSRVTSVIEQYDAFSKNIEYKVVNYHTNPVLLNSYSITADANVDDSVLVARKDKSKAKLIAASEMIVNNQSGTVFKLENLLTNAIGAVSSDKQMTVCFTTGHGEIVGAVKTDENGNNVTGGMMLVGFLRSENINVYQYDLSTGEIPEGIDIVMIMSPESDFTQAEIDSLDNYLLKGGSVAVSLPSAIVLPRLEGYLKNFWGISANNDIISEADPQSQVDETGVYFYANKTAHDIVKDIYGRVITSYARSLSFNPTGDIEADVLLTSSSNAYSMPIGENGIDTQKVQAGQFNLAYALEKPLNGSFENTAKLIVTSTESIWGITHDSITNYDKIIDISLEEKSFGNSDFVINALSHSFGEAIESINVPVKTSMVSVLTMSRMQAGLTSKLLGFVLPFAVILAGVIIWFKRRNR